MIRAALKRATPQPRSGLDIPPGPWPLDRAYAYCEALARAHYENFPVASRFVPARLRPHMWAVYAFARTADDFADEPAFEGKRAESLEAWSHELRRCFHGEADHPIFIALRDTVERCELPITPLENLLAAFEMDLRVRRYATFRDLRGYTALSAEPVGRAVLCLFGHRSPELQRYSDEVCTALQHANFWQDVGVDAGRDRIYLPAEDLHYFGVAEQDLKNRRATVAFRDLLRFEVARTRSLFERGRPLCDLVPGPLAFELKLIWLGGMAILDKIEAYRYDVLARRPTLSLAEKAQLVVRAGGWSARRLLR